ncbi:MAG: PDZ domain-containing protein [Chitinophagaceae bacterium]|nr:PDZ domain-containing protein [Chitinophagaceae bacterium]
MTRLLASALFLVSCAFNSFAQAPSWLRYPSISPDGTTIVFTYKGDLYKVASTGGTATPLTMHEAHDFMPVWRKDGKSIAFASDRYGNFDVFIIPAEGGEAKRITYHSANEYPYSFTNDNKNVVFGATRMDLPTNRQYPTGYMSELYNVSVNGGRVTQILTTPAEDVKFSKDGNKLIYTNKPAGENAWRKHHTSAVTRDVALYDMKTGTHKLITSFNGEDRNPVFTNDESGFFYLSEESGSFNVHKMNMNGGKSEKLTSYKKHPVRFLSSSNDGLLCYSYDGELYTMKAGSSPQKVNISILADARSNNEKIYRVTSGSGMSVAPNGKEVAFLYRGDVFVTSVDGGITKRITATPEQETEVVFSPDGKKIMYGGERNDKWSVYEATIERKEEPYFYAATLIKETPLFENNNNNTQALYSPDGKEIAYIENRNQLRIYNIASKQSRTVLTGDQLFAFVENDQYFQWSPDSKWLLFDYAVPGSAVGEVGLVSADGKKIENLTLSGFNDGNAKWIMGGKGMMWFSNRDGLRAAAMSGGAQMDVYAMFFTQDAFDKFKLSKEEAALQKEIEENKAKADTSKKKTPAKDSVVIDWNGLTLRKTKLTIHSSNMSDALVSKDGETLYYLARFERGMNLWTTNLRTRETKMLVPLNAGFANMVWDKEQKTIFLNSDGGFMKIDPNSGKQDRIGINGEMMVDSYKERMYMFEHVWRRTKNTFYTKSFHGIDWDSYKPDYEKYIPHIGSNYEFSEMLSELLGELNVSHSGSSYFNFNPNGDATAALGIFYDYNYKGNGVKIVEVIKDGPLDKAGMNVSAGIIIESIDGETITADKDLPQYLNRKAGKNVLIVLVDGTTKRELTIKPVSIGEENGLLYRRWVKRNADEVDQMSNGTLGYVHIPGMSDGAYRTTYEEIMGKYFHKKGIVVDTRNNGGGDLVADLAMFLSGKKFMDYGNDVRNNGFEPNFRWTKPGISLANEGNYSDGHCYAYMVKEVGIGKLVGMPVPGTCTFAAWEALMDTGIRWGAPTVGCKDTKGNYLENAQTEPDIKLRNEYEKVSTGVDEQLQMAVKELLKGK